MREVFGELPYQEGTEIIDRLRQLNFDEDQLRISLHWSGEPDEPWILDIAACPWLAASRPSRLLLSPHNRLLRLGAGSQRVCRLAPDRPRPSG
jgi:hypothetical protein